MTKRLPIWPEHIGKAVTYGDGLVWVNFDHTDERGMAMLPDLFEVHSADVADCHIRTPVPKLHRYPDSPIRTWTDYRAKTA